MPIPINVPFVIGGNSYRLTPQIEKAVKELQKNGIKPAWTAFRNQIIYTGLFDSFGKVMTVDGKECTAGGRNIIESLQKLFETFSTKVVTSDTGGFKKHFDLNKINFLKY